MGRRDWSDCLMPTTSNFGWTTPADTDLVKDGALAIRTLGNGIDTSMAELKGGTTGQILSKTSNTDMDFTWIANDQGDITGVTAGTGISGGGTSGTVTITNSMATEITAAGDIIVGTGSGTFDNLPIGTTGQVLTADTTVSPYKVKWSTTATPAFVGCRLFNSGNLTITNNTITAVTWDSETFDTDGFHSTSTNTNRITIPSGKAGYYRISSDVSWQSNTTGARETRIRKNGSVIFYNYQSFASGEFVMGNNIIVNLAETDYIELVVFQTSGGNLTLYGGSTLSQLSAEFLGA
jgi:hypothetical protein